MKTKALSGTWLADGELQRVHGGMQREDPRLRARLDRVVIEPIIEVGKKVWKFISSWF